MFAQTFPSIMLLRWLAIITALNLIYQSSCLANTDGYALHDGFASQQPMESRVNTILDENPLIGKVPQASQHRYLTNDSIQMDMMTF